MALLEGAAAKNLRELALELDRNAVTLKNASFKLQKLGFPRDLIDPASCWLRELDDRGWKPEQVARLVEAVAEERARVERARDDIELVWTGPDDLGTESRDSARVLEELFQSATTSVLMAGYNFRPGAHFDALAHTTKVRPWLRVELFAHVFTDNYSAIAAALAAHNTSLREALSGVVAGCLKAYRPSAERLELARKKLFHMHAKCLVIDARRVLVTSANFSHTAQERNVEVGIAMDDPVLASRIHAQFETLVKRGDMVPHTF